MKSRRNASGLLFAAVAAKAAIVALASLPATAEMATRLPYAVTSVAENWIWVAGGMAMALYRGLPLVRGSEKDVYKRQCKYSTSLRLMAATNGSRARLS